MLFIFISISVILTILLFMFNTFVREFSSNKTIMLTLIFFSLTIISSFFINHILNPNPKLPSNKGSSKAKDPKKDKASIHPLLLNQLDNYVYGFTDSIGNVYNKTGQIITGSN